MARKPSAAGRLLVGGVAALLLLQLSSFAFVAPPRTVYHEQAAILAGAIAAAPQAASAFGNELRDDGFGAQEQVAIFIPFVFVVLAYLEWESKQEPTDNVTGAATLGKQVDGPGKGYYFRRSPESG
mmetsp:Transcript_69429/g.160881  ORF Transcript_69429/g.160881 Transcript_69429/m.160881 type:complete len:126 (+) Transcript_69429:61-438(+)